MTAAPGLIAVTAPTGNVGRPLAARLAEAGIRARLLVRDGRASAAHESVLADLDRPETLPPALEGVERLFLLSPGPDSPAQDAAVIDAAREAGVAHIVLLSSLGVEAGGIGGGRAHAPGEAALAASGIAATMLRPSEYMTNTLMWVPELQARGTASVPSGTGRVAHVAPQDIARVAFAALTNPGHEGAIYRLTGPELLSTAEVVARLGAALGVSARHVDVSDAAFRAGAQAAGVPAAVIEILSEYYAALPTGVMAILSDDVQRVTGQPPTPFAQWARAALAGT